MLTRTGLRQSDLHATDTGRGSAGPIAHSLPGSIWLFMQRWFSKRQRCAGLDQACQVKTPTGACCLTA